MPLQIAYLSDGRLFLKEGEGKARSVDSVFGQKAIETAQQLHQQREWKMKGVTQLMGSAPGMAQEFDPLRVHVHITAVTRSTRDGELTYALETDSAGGLFLYNYQDNEERRLFHKEHFRAHDIDRHPETHWLVFSQRNKDLTSNIVVTDDEGLDRREITEGDSLDEAPSWVPGEGYQIVYQSAGVARSREGYQSGASPYAIHVLDLQSKEFKTLAESEEYDYLLPHMTLEGDLLFIRRPHEQKESFRTVLRLLGDIVFFPFRFVRALIFFFDFMSKAFSQKPLITSTGKKMEQEDQASLMFRGRMIETKKQLRGKANDDTASLVPASWELVRKKKDGEEIEVLAKGVASYDVSPEGEIVYTNGRAIYQVEDKGGRKLLAKDRLIQEVIIL